MEEEKKGKQYWDWGWARSILFAIVVAFLIRAYILTPVLVEGASMEPTLHDHEKIIVSKTISWIGEIHRGDIVIIKDDEVKINYVKRVIGLPGETIKMKDDVLFVNGKEIREPYLDDYKKTANQLGSRLTGDFGPIEVPKDHYFVMGDNRPHSMDSRTDSLDTLGFIETDRIIGKSKFVLFPFKNIRITK